MRCMQNAMRAACQSQIPERWLEDVLSIIGVCKKSLRGWKRTGKKTGKGTGKGTRGAHLEYDSYARA